MRRAAVYSWSSFSPRGMTVRTKVRPSSVNSVQFSISRRVRRAMRVSYFSVPLRGSCRAESSRPTSDEPAVARLAHESGAGGEGSSTQVKLQPHRSAEDNAQFHRSADSPAVPRPVRCRSACRCCAERPERECLRFARPQDRRRACATPCAVAASTIWPTSRSTKSPRTGSFRPMRVTSRSSTSVWIGFRSAEYTTSRGPPAIGAAGSGGSAASRGLAALQRQVERTRRRSASRAAPHYTETIRDSPCRTAC